MISSLTAGENEFSKRPTNDYLADVFIPQTSGTMNPDDAISDEALRKLNACALILHLVQGILMLVVSLTVDKV